MTARALGIATAAADRTGGPGSPSVRAELAAAIALTAGIAVSHLQAAIQAARSSLLLAAVLLALALAFAACGWATARAIHGPAAMRATAGLAAGLALTWIVSRTAGLPGAAGPSAIGLLDAVTATGELVLAVLCLALASDRPRLASTLCGPSYVALAATCVALSVGCGISSATTGAGSAAGSRGGPSQGRPLSLLCHLY